MTETRFIPDKFLQSDEQLAIQCAVERFIVIDANAGAAKTTTLALRVGEALARGVAPERILLLTYTDSGCVAMQHALKRVGVAAALRYKLKVLTFEQFCLKVLYQWERVAVPYHATLEPLKAHVLLALRKVAERENEPYPDALEFAGSEDALVEEYLRVFAHLKGTLKLAAELQDRRVTPSVALELEQDYALLLTYGAYENLRRGGHPDRHAFRGVGDATFDVAQLALSQDPLWDQEHLLGADLRLVLVDEMHDLNRAMFTVLVALLKSNPQVQCVGVGDKDQVIHAQAGAQAELMGTALEQAVGRLTRYSLTASYRFGSNLAKVAGRFAAKKYASLCPHTTQVQLYASDSAQASVQSIINVALERAAPAVKTTAKKKIGKPSELAILLRHPYQSLALENG